MEYKFLNKESFKAYMKEFGELYTLCFNVPMNESEVEWRYLKNLGTEVLSCVAIDNGKLVANYSATPMQMIKDGKVIKIAQSLNTMTHPDYMGRGLFVDLASRLYKYLADNGYKLIMGYPNNISNRTFLTKLNWKDICVVPTLEINLDKVRKKSKDTEMVVLEDHNFDMDYSHCIYDGQDEISLYKSQEYLKWRYAANPAAEYYNFVIANDNIASSRIILKEFRNRINMVDTYFKNENEQKVLMDYAIDFGHSRGKELLTVWAKLGTKEHLTLESYGAILASPVSYFGACVFDQSGEFDDCYDAGKWYFSMSDDNVY